MNTFYLIIALSVFFVFVSRRYKNKSLFILECIILILFCGLRNPASFSDLMGYKSLLLTGEPEESWMSTDNVNIGYVYFMQLFSIFSKDFQLFLFAITLIVVISYVNFIKKYLSYNVLALLIFVLALYFFSYCALRQFIALAFSLFAYNAVLERRLNLFILYCLLALSFHSTAVMIFPIYFLYGLDLSKKNIVIAIIISIIICFFVHVITSYLSGIIGYYAGYITDGSEESPTNRLLMKGFILCLYIKVMRDDLASGIGKLVLILMFLNIVLYLAGGGIDGVYRLRYYYDIAEIIGIPLIMMKIRRCDMPLAYKILVYVYVIALFLSCNNYLTSEEFGTGYKFFWENKN